MSAYQKRCSGANCTADHAFPPSEQNDTAALDPDTKLLVFSRGAEKKKKEKETETPGNAQMGVSLTTPLWTGRTVNLSNHDNFTVVSLIRSIKYNLMNMLCISVIQEKYNFTTHCFF